MYGLAFMWMCAVSDFDNNISDSKTSQKWLQSIIFTGQKWIYCLSDWNWMDFCFVVLLNAIIVQYLLRKQLQIFPHECMIASTERRDKNWIMNYDWSSKRGTFVPVVSLISDQCSIEMNNLRITQSFGLLINFSMLTHRRKRRVHNDVLTRKSSNNDGW